MTKARTLADNFAADINGITAGTGITGGGTSGTVTITNQMATTIDAKGDLVVGTGADTFGRLAVASTAGYVLTVDSAEATGLKWSAPAAAGFVGCYAYAANSNSQSVNDSTATVVNLDSELFDTDGFHSTSSNTGRITIPTGKGGKYLVVGQVALGAGNGTGAREIYLMKNGTTTYLYTNYPMPNSLNFYPTFMQINIIVDLVATDYIQMMIAHNQGTALNVRGNGYSPGSTFLAVQYLGA